MLPGEPVFPPEWVQVRDALKAGYKPPILDPVPPPPQPVWDVGDATLVSTEAGTEIRPTPVWDSEEELDAVRRCLCGPLRGVDYVAGVLVP
jgi:hypothetical protein